jgi:hypothetical protein
VRTAPPADRLTRAAPTPLHHEKRAPSGAPNPGRAVSNKCQKDFPNSGSWTPARPATRKRTRVCPASSLSKTHPRPKASPIPAPCQLPCGEYVALGNRHRQRRRGADRVGRRDAERLKGVYQIGG